jgi:2-hydroxychromene-2-carboxylate isomerase
MSLAQQLRSKILTLMFDPRVIRSLRWLIETRRRLSGKRHVVSVFLQIDDPYSYILSHYLPSLAKQYDIELRLYLSDAEGEDYQPEPLLLAEYSIADCIRLARELGIPFLDKGSLPPTEHRVGISDAVAAQFGTDRFDDVLKQALEVFWRGDTAAAASLSQAGNSGGEALASIAKSQKLLRKLGHYNSAMLHYGGEWYWGVDRLHYLTQRLTQLGLAAKGSPDARLMSIQQAMRVSLPIKPPVAARNLPPIEYFHSFRSPYSYLALPRILEIADAFGIEVKIRPVLPMVMRGMKVPLRKLLYIANDTCREAARKNLPFGKIADPVGVGAERCLAVYCYAESEQRAREFVLNAGAAIWSEAIDVSTDKGMRKVSGRSGLFWPDVKKTMENDEWRPVIEANRESMMDSGSWGVPTVRMGEFLAWGQDRDWMLVRHLEELCESGDGIIV